MFKAEDIDPIGVQCGNFAMKVIDTADFAKKMSGSACMKIVLGNEIFPTEQSERGVFTFTFHAFLRPKIEQSHVASAENQLRSETSQRRSGSCIAGFFLTLW